MRLLSAEVSARGIARPIEEWPSYRRYKGEDAPLRRALLRAQADEAYKLSVEVLASPDERAVMACDHFLMTHCAWMSPGPSEEALRVALRDFTPGSKAMQTALTGLSAFAACSDAPPVDPETHALLDDLEGQPGLPRATLLNLALRRAHRGDPGAAAKLAKRGGGAVAAVLGVPHHGVQADQATDLDHAADALSAERRGDWASAAGDAEVFHGRVDRFGASAAIWEEEARRRAATHLAHVRLLADQTEAGASGLATALHDAWRLDDETQRAIELERVAYIAYVTQQHVTGVRAYVKAARVHAKARGRDDIRRASALIRAGDLLLRLDQPGRARVLLSAACDDLGLDAWYSSVGSEGLCYLMVALAKLGLDRELVDRLEAYLPERRSRRQALWVNYFDYFCSIQDVSGPATPGFGPAVRALAEHLFTGEAAYADDWPALRTLIMRHAQSAVSRLLLDERLAEAEPWLEALALAQMRGDKSASNRAYAASLVADINLTMAVDDPVRVARAENWLAAALEIGGDDPDLVRFRRRWKRSLEVLRQGEAVDLGREAIAQQAQSAALRLERTALDLRVRAWLNRAGDYARRGLRGAKVRLKTLLRK